MAVFTIGWFVEIRAYRVTKIMAVGVGPEGGVDDSDVVFANVFGVIAVIGVVAFF